MHTAAMRVQVQVGLSQSYVLFCFVFPYNNSILYIVLVSWIQHAAIHPIFLSFISLSCIHLYIYRFTALQNDYLSLSLHIGSLNAEQWNNKATDSKKHKTVVIKPKNHDADSQQSEIFIPNMRACPTYIKFVLSLATNISTHQKLRELSNTVSRKQVFFTYFFT